MKTPLAWCNLCQDKLRTLVATGGVTFVLTLVFMELGFLGSVTNTATLVLDQLDFDIAIVARGYRNLNESGAFPRLRLYEAQSVPGVALDHPALRRLSGVAKRAGPAGRYIPLPPGQASADPGVRFSSA